MATLERQQAIRELLENFRGIQSLKRLTAELNYEFVNKPLPRGVIKSDGKSSRLLIAVLPVVMPFIICA